MESECFLIFCKWEYLHLTLNSKTVQEPIKSGTLKERGSENLVFLVYKGVHTYCTLKGEKELGKGW